MSTMSWWCFASFNTNIISTQFPSTPGDAMEKALRCACFCGGVLFTSKFSEIIANGVEISNLFGYENESPPT